MVPLIVVAVAVVAVLIGALAVVVVVVAGAVVVVVVVLVLLAAVGVIVAVVVHIGHAIQEFHVHFLDHGVEFLVHQNLHLGVSVTMVAGVVAAAGVDGCVVVVALEVVRRSESAIDVVFTAIAELHFSHLRHASQLHFLFHGLILFVHHLWHPGYVVTKHVVVCMHVSIIAMNNAVLYVQVGHFGNMGHSLSLLKRFGCLYRMIVAPSSHHRLGTLSPVGDTRKAASEPLRVPEPL